jgi:hypothetical protein
VKAPRTVSAHLLAGLIVASFCTALHAQALWTANGVPICTYGGDQRFPVIASDSAGGAIIAWQDDRWGALDTDIYAHRIDSSGQVEWTSDGLAVSWPSGQQEAPEIVADGAGGAIIVWRDTRNGAGYDIYAQKLDDMGTTLWSMDGELICDAPDDQQYQRLVSDGAGGAIIVWQDERWGIDDYDIYAQRIDANGDTLWAEDGIAVCYALDVQALPSIIGDGSGGAIIAWQSWNDTTEWDIYAQRIDADGDTLWAPNGVAVCVDTCQQGEPELVTDGAGGAIIVWKDRRNGNENEIWGQRIDADGDVLWWSQGVAICTTANNYIAPIQIINDGSGGAIVAWGDEESGSDVDIRAQRIDGNGNIFWPENGLGVCTAPWTQAYPEMVTDGDGGAIIAWMDGRSSTVDIYSQRVTALGDTIPPHDGLAVSNHYGAQEYHSVIGDGSGGAIIVWEDDRSGKEDIYAQHINFDPSPLLTAIEDVPDDQGRQVAVRWNRSYLDDPQYRTVTDYTVWRKYPSGAKIESFGREWDGVPPRDRSDRIWRRIERIDRTGRTKTEYWEYIDLVEAAYLEGYAYLAPTLTDSSASGAPYYSYFISANTADPFIHWHSDPDSGYSVDDIGPAPTVLHLAHPTTKGAKGSLQLSWDEVTAGTDGSPETGPITYRLYADTAAFFTPSPATLITSTPNLSYQHSDARIGDPDTDLFYQVVVTDGSGNASAGSNRTGEIDWDLATTTGTDYAWLALALDDSTLAMASDLEAAIEAHSSPTVNCLTVSQWNPTAQTYTHYTTVPVPMGDFALTEGLPCRVETDDDAVVTLTGAVPTAGSLSFQLQTTTGTDYTWISLPLELDTLAMASDLEAHIESHSDPVTDCLTVSRWNATAQTYTHYTTVPIPMGDFAIRPGRPYRVEVTSDALWPYTGKGLQQFRRVLRRR